MLFCLSVCDRTGRVILDQDFHGPTLAMVEGKDWKEARHSALRNVVLDAFTYKAGYGWVRRERPH